MGGVAKKVKKVGHQVGSAIGDLNDMAMHPKSTLKKWTKNIIEPFVGDMPATPDAPLMPDFESIAKARRRGRTRRLGRAETTLTDTLG